MLTLGGSGAWADADYTGITLTFSRADGGSGTATDAVADVTVNVTDQDGNTIEGVTASLTSTSITQLKTGSATALSRTSNAVLAPNAGYDNKQNSTIEYTFCVTGLSTEFTYDRAALDVYALNAAGAQQYNNGNTVRLWTFDIATGTAADATTSFFNQTDNDICTVTAADGGLYHKLWGMVGTDEAATETLYIKVPLTKTSGDSYGCYAGISEVRLYSLGTHEWESKSGWVQASSGYADVLGFGVHTPTGVESFKLNQIQVNMLTKSDGDYDCYLAITTTAPATSSTSSVSYSDIVAISDNHLAPSSSTAKLESYTFSNGVCLAPNTTYYCVFLSSCEQTSGSYTAKSSRIALNHSDYGTYAYNVYTTSGTQTTWWPYYKATLTDVEDTNVYITDLTPLYNGKAYVITTTRGRWQFNGSSATSMGQTSSDVNLSDANQQIAIIKQGSEYYLYSIAAGKYLTAANTLYASPFDPVTITASSATNGNYQWFFSFDSSHNININGIPNLVIDTWDTHDVGNTCAIIEAAGFDNTTALAAFTNYGQRITDYCNYHPEVGTNFAHSYNNEIGYPSQSSTGYTELASILTSDSPTADDYANLPTKYAAYLAETTIKTPPAGFYKVYYPVSSSSKKYVTVTGTVPTATVTPPSDASAIWYYDGTHLIAYSNGYQVKGNASGNEEMQVGDKTITFSKSAVSSTFGYMNVTPDGCSPWYVSPDETDYVLNRWTGGTHDGQQFQVEAVTTLPITFAGEYASFYSPVALTIPDNNNLKVYTGTVNGEWLTLNEVSGTLPANTGVILHLDNWTETTTVNFPVLSTVTSGTSALTGTVAAAPAVSGGVLVLGKENDTWGIYNYTGTLGGFKAYMTKAPEVKGLRFDLGTATSIDEVLNETLSRDAVIYNAAGQRLVKLQHGLNLVNGKKVLIK